MRELSRLIVRPRVIATTPEHFGVNVEVQDHADRTNLWDWIADSGATCVREFHPEQSLRVNRPVAADAYGDLADRAAFDRWRQSLLDDPAGRVRWQDFQFDQSYRWLGTPDAIAAKLNEVGVEGLYSLGYSTGEFPRPLVRDVEFMGRPDDGQIDWSAAACGYEYYFAVMWHFASRYGARRFMMINEPENRWGWFHMPDDVRAVEGQVWQKLHVEDSPESARYFGILATQFGVLARLARMAMDDVADLLAKRDGQRPALRLSGPTGVAWQPLWQHAAKHLDSLDFHHYNENTASFRPMFAAAAQAAAHAGPDKTVSLTEFNRYSGGVDVDRILFSMDNSLATAELMMRVLGLSAWGDPPLELATLYLLSFPSTHRNYKHLLYGDMNWVDWTGQDAKLWDRGDAWYPTFEAQQLRFATPAYAMFRMLARNTAYGPARCGGYDVLDVGLVNPTSAGPEHIHDRLGVLTVRQADRLIVNLLNPLPNRARNVEIDLSALPGTYRYAVTRVSDRKRRDRVVQAGVLEEPRCRLDVPGKSLTQWIAFADDLSEAQPVELREVTATPGNLATLGYLQTTRLRAIARLGDKEIELTDVNVQWDSSDNETLRVDQGGLVQRMTPNAPAGRVGARVCDGPAWPEREVGPLQ